MPASNAALLHRRLPKEAIAPMGRSNKQLPETRRLSRRRFSSRVRAFIFRSMRAHNLD